MSKLEDRRKEKVVEVLDTLARQKGRPPLLREINNGLGDLAYASPSGVSPILRKLEREGRVARIASRRSHRKYVVSQLPSTDELERGKLQSSSSNNKKKKMEDKREHVEIADGPNENSQAPSASRLVLVGVIAGAALTAVTILVMSWLGMALGFAMFTSITVVVALLGEALRQSRMYERQDARC